MCCQPSATRWNKSRRDASRQAGLGRTRSADFFASLAATLLGAWFVPFSIASLQVGYEGLVEVLAATIAKVWRMMLIAAFRIGIVVAASHTTSIEHRTRANSAFRNGVLHALARPFLIRAYVRAFSEGGAWCFGLVLAERKREIFAQHCPHEAASGERVLSFVADESSGFTVAS